jgi:hypothetical protein
MPTWSTIPPPDEAPYAFRIVRTPAKGTLSAVATATEVTGSNTHFAHNRTLPCEGPDQCKLCAEGYSWRWHGYLSAVLTATLEHVLFEFTAAASDTFQNYYLLHVNMRGCWFAAHRPSGRPNGRVVITCKYADPQRMRLPDPPDVRAILCHIWNVKADHAVDIGRTRQFGADIGIIPYEGDGRYRSDPAR